MFRTAASSAQTRSTFALRTLILGTPIVHLVGMLALTLLSSSSALAQVGAVYCAEMQPNSTGVRASIQGSGSPVIALNNLVLTSLNLPPHAAAYFLCSRTQGLVLNPGGSAGTLCLGNPIGRLVGGVVANSGAFGFVSVPANLGG